MLMIFLHVVLTVEYCCLLMILAKHFRQIKSYYDQQLLWNDLNSLSNWSGVSCLLILQPIQKHFYLIFNFWHCMCWITVQSILNCLTRTWMLLFAGIYSGIIIMTMFLLKCTNIRCHLMYVHLAKQIQWLCTKIKLYTSLIKSYLHGIHNSYKTSLNFNKFNGGPPNSYISNDYSSIYK